jgi:hypothetical protein
MNVERGRSRCRCLAGRGLRASSRGPFSNQLAVIGGEDRFRPVLRLALPVDTVDLVVAREK